jgi:hypothetical protein
LEDARADIQSFTAGAKAVGWTDEEIEYAVEFALDAWDDSNDAGVSLYGYCTDDSW